MRQKRKKEKKTTKKQNKVGSRIPGAFKAPQLQAQHMCTAVAALNAVRGGSRIALSAVPSGAQVHTYTYLRCCPHPMQMSGHSSTATSVFLRLDGRPFESFRLTLYLQVP